MPVVFTSATLRLGGDFATFPGGRQTTKKVFGGTQTNYDRGGQGIALRTAMRGALMVNRRRSNRKRTGTFLLEAQPYRPKKSRSKRTCAALFRR